MLAAHMLRRGFAAILLALIGGACARHDAPQIDSRHAPRKIPAIKQAVAADDADAIPKLIDDLESDDPAVRFFAMQGLERLTGQTFGYLYYDPLAQRRQAVMKWRQWLEENHR